MPYRRLPNTDVSRIKALRQAYNKQSENSQVQIISHKNYYKIKTFLPKFEAKLKHQRSIKNAINARSKKHNKLMRSCRLYISHFIQVVNFAIIRGEMPSSVRKFYKINENDKTVPSLNLDTQLLEWGKKIIEGENHRINAGGAPIYSPSIALVKIHYGDFKESNFHYKTAQNVLKLLNKELISYRKNANKIIASIWNSIEHFYQNIPEDQKRKHCEEFGIIYVFRKGEKERIERKQRIEELTLSFDF